MQYKKIRELADRKRGITKKKDPFGLRFRHFQGEISSETGRQKDASFALHWKKWGIGQIQSIIGNKVTVNFENFGKRVINVENIKLEKINE